MPLFRCEECGCVENTATGWYWSAKMESTPNKWRRYLCSEHGPQFIDGEFTDEQTGQWHGIFDKQSAVGWYIDKSGFLWETPKGAPHAYGAVIGRIQGDQSIKNLSEDEIAQGDQLRQEENIRVKEIIQNTSVTDNPKYRPWVSLSNKKSKQKKR